jgi:hypothetical protein
MSELTLPDDIYQRILTCMGYPIVSEEDLGVTREQVEDLLILPALKNVYFKWFPKQEEDTYEISTTYDISFPDEWTWGVLDLRLNTTPYYSTIKTGNPLINEINIRDASSGGYRDMWNSGNDYGYSQVEYTERSLRQSIIDTYKAFKKSIDYQNRRVKGYTNTAGQLSIIWAKYSLDWNDVDFRQEEQVIKLAQSYILEFFGRLRDQEAGQNPADLDGGSLIDRAEALYEEVMESWKNYPRAVILRG